MGQFLRYHGAEPKVTKEKKMLETLSHQFIADAERKISRGTG